MNCRTKTVLAAAALAIFLTAFEVRRPVVSLGPIGFTTSELAAIFFLLTLSVWAIMDDARLFTRRALDAAVLFFVATNFVSAAFAADKPSALKFSLRMILAALVYFGISRLPARARSHLVVAGSVTVALFVVTVVGLLENYAQWIYWPYWLSPWQERTATFGAFYNVRVAATLPFPTVLSMYLELAVPLALTLGLCLSARRGIPRGRKWWLPVIIIGGLGAVMLVQVLTFTRSALAATLVSMLAGAGIALLCGYGRRVAGYLALGAVILLAVLGVSVAVSDRMATRLGVADQVKRYGAEYTVLKFPEGVKTGQESSARLRIRNTSDVSWSRAGDDSVILCYRWIEYPSKDSHEVDFIITELPGDIGPGEEIEADVAFKTPDEPGRYILLIEAAKTGVGWLSATNGVPPAVVPLEVGSNGGMKLAIEETGESPIWAAPELAAPSRSKLWHAAIRMWKEHPLFGVGPGQFRKLYSEYMPGVQPNERLETHNVFLEALANTGIVGLAAMLWLLAGTALAQLRMVRDGSLVPDKRLLALGLLVALVAYVSHGFLDFFLWQTGVAFLFFTELGLTAWLADRKIAEEG